MLPFYPNGTGLRLLGYEYCFGEFETARCHHVLNKGSHAIGDFRKPLVEILAIPLRPLLPLQQLAVGSRVAGSNLGNILMNRGHHERALLDELRYRSLQVDYAFFDYHARQSRSSNVESQANDRSQPTLTRTRDQQSRPISITSSTAPRLLRCKSSSAVRGYSLSVIR